MNLYKVTCVHRGHNNTEEKDIYVVALSPSHAEDGAMTLVNDRNWKFDDYVASIELIASTHYGNAAFPLVLPFNTA